MHSHHPEQNFAQSLRLLHGTNTPLYDPIGAKVPTFQQLLAGHQVSYSATAAKNQQVAVMIYSLPLGEVGISDSVSNGLSDKSILVGLKHNNNLSFPYSQHRGSFLNQINFQSLSRLSQEYLSREINRIKNGCTVSSSL